MDDLLGFFFSTFDIEINKSIGAAFFGRIFLLNNNQAYRVGSAINAVVVEVPWHSARELFIVLKDSRHLQ